MSGFRLSAKNLFLTYPQCGLTKELALEKLQNKSCIDIKDYVIAKEAHEDGTPHLHVYLSLARRCNIINPTALDLIDDGQTFHGNYQASRDPAATIRYCKKDGEFIQSDGIEANDQKLSWGDIASRATDAENYLSMVRTHYPRDAALNWDKLVSYANQLFPPAIVPYQPEFSPDEFANLPTEITDWVSSFIGMYDSVYGCSLI